MADFFGTLSAANAAFLLSSLQTLLPVNYSIFTRYASDTIGSNDVGYAYWNGYSDGTGAVSTQKGSDLKFGANTPLLNTASTTMTGQGLNDPWAIWWIASLGVSMPHAIVDGQAVTLSFWNWSSDVCTLAGQTVAGTFKGSCGGGAILVILPVGEP